MLRCSFGSLAWGLGRFRSSLDSHSMKGAESWNGNGELGCDIDPLDMQGLQGNDSSHHGRPPSRVAAKPMSGWELGFVQTTQTGQYPFFQEHALNEKRIPNMTFLN